MMTNSNTYKDLMASIVEDFPSSGDIIHERIKKLLTYMYNQHPKAIRPIEINSVDVIGVFAGSLKYLLKLSEAKGYITREVPDPTIIESPPVLRYKLSDKSIMLFAVSGITKVEVETDSPETTLDTTTATSMVEEPVVVEVPSDDKVMDAINTLNTYVMKKFEDVDVWLNTVGDYSKAGRNSIDSKLENLDIKFNNFGKYLIGLEKVQQATRHDIEHLKLTVNLLTNEMRCTRDMVLSKSEDPYVYADIPPSSSLNKPKTQAPTVDFWEKYRTPDIRNFNEPRMPKFPIPEKFSPMAECAVVYMSVAHMKEQIIASLERIVQDFSLSKEEQINCCVFLAPRDSIEKHITTSKPAISFEKNTINYIRYVGVLTTGTIEDWKLTLNNTIENMTNTPDLKHGFLDINYMEIINFYYRAMYMLDDVVGAFVFTIRKNR